MIAATSVTVLRPAKTVDRLGNEVDGVSTAEQVDGVLVVPGATADMEASRPDGATVALTLHFPKAYKGRLDGCSVVLDGEWAGTYRVVGDPMPYMPENTPGKFDRPVEVEAAHG